VVVTKLHFSRFEFKYLLPQALRTEVEAELQHFVELDPYVESCEQQRYVVRSLYWDDPSLSAFHDKMDGRMHRSKFRLRTYTTDPAAATPRFLEIKGRHNNLVFKHRAPVAIGPAECEVGGERLSQLIEQRGVEGPVRNEFAFQCARRRIQPYVLIDYLRRPYVSRFDPEFRLTFDEELWATATDRLFARASDRRRRVASGYTVMELKFRHHVPAWFHKIIQSYELRRRSFSKVCEGTMALEMQPQDA